MTAVDQPVGPEGRSRGLPCKLDFAEHVSRSEKTAWQVVCEPGGPPCYQPGQIYSSFDFPSEALLLLAARGLFTR